ncbi:MAG: HU family DNA-binding protein [Planctomycetota bacterium]|nr:HU family DNA-binding protein [Planctomycetota bacterium]
MELRGFGVFEVRIKEAHKAHNPRTGEEVMVPERRRFGLKYSEALTAQGINPRPLSLLS